MSTALFLPSAGTYATAYEQASEKYPVEVDRARDIRNYITWVEDQLLDQEQATCGLDHTLVDGLYTRTMFCPAGTILTGAIHKKAGLCMLVQGTISILTENGAALLRAPLLFPSAAGIRRLGHCHTDVIWATVHAVTSTTLDDIEAELFTFPE